MTADGLSTTDSAVSETGSDPELAIVGVGNRIMGDDGLGPEIVERLAASQAFSTADVRLIDAGTTGFLALEAMSGAERAVVVDAIETGEPPGTIQEYRCVDGAFETERPEMTMHDVSFTEAMLAGRDVYDLPREIHILGVEPADVSVGVELSEAVDAAATEIVHILTAMVDDADATDTETGPTGPERA